MILNSEQLAAIFDMKEDGYLRITKQALESLRDTIVDLKRQLAVSNEALDGDWSLLDAYVQERVQKEIEAHMELRFEDKLKASNTCPLCEKDYVHDHEQFVKAGYPFAAAIANVGSLHAVSAILGHMVQERVDRAVLAESEWWHKRTTPCPNSGTVVDRGKEERLATNRAKVR